jgi:hypothetical protein
MERIHLPTPDEDEQKPSIICELLYVKSVNMPTAVDLKWVLVHEIPQIVSLALLYHTDNGPGMMAYKRHFGGLPSALTA